MEYQKVISLTDNKPNQPTKFTTYTKLTSNK